MRYTGGRKKTSPRRKKIVISFVIVILAAAIVFVLFNVKGAARISNVTSIIVDPVVSFCRNAKDWVTESISSFKENKAIIKENQELKEKLVEQEAKDLIIELYEDEIEEYKSLLGLQKELYDFQLISADIVFSTLGNIQSGLTINKGLADGIRSGMPVLYGDKLVGVVRNTDLISARVKTIFEKDFTVIAKNSRNHEIVRIRGNSTAYLDQLLVCDYLPLRSDIQVGDQIETSVLGEIYPDSIKIGVVEKIDYDRDGLPTRAYIRPYIKPGEIDTVYVLDYREIGDG